MFDVLILLFAIVLFTVLAFKRVGALPMAGIVALITCILAQMPVLDTMLGPFMESAANYVKNYFFIFFLGAVFSAFYEGSGAAKSIARFLSRLTGGKHVAVLVFIITSILTFGGISGFVVYFVMYPITLQLFQKNDMSRILIPASITAGCWTISMIAPGSPSIQNVIGMKSLGTAATAAFVPGVISVIAELILIIILFNGFKMAVEGAVFWGIVAACILFFPYLKRFETYVELLNRGGVNAGGALLNTAIVVGFGGVAQNTEGFRIIVDAVLHMNISPLIFVAVAVAVCAGMCGSASGGMGVAFNALKDTFVSLGINLEYVHRIGVIAAGTLDTLPHQGGQITILAITHMNHKTAYLDICVTQLIIPLITVFAVTIPLCAMGL